MTIFRKHYILNCRLYDIVIFRLQLPISSIIAVELLLVSDKEKLIIFMVF